MEWNSSDFVDNVNPTMSDETRLNSLYFKCINLDNNYCDLVLAAPTTTPASRCGTGIVSLAASGCTGTYTWYNTTTGGTSIGTGSTYSPSISTTTTYYVECNAVGCTSSRASVTGTILTIPAAPTVTGGSNCGTGNVTLTTSACTGGTVQWYATQTGTTVLSSGTSFSLSSLTSSVVYFAACTDANTCVSATRNYGVATINPVPNPTLTGINSLCVGLAASNNGKLLLTNFKSSDTFSQNLGTSYNSGTATAPTSIPTNGEVLTPINDPAINISYNVRVTNVEGCYVDKSVTLVNQCSPCPISFCEPAGIVKTK